MNVNNVKICVIGLGHVCLPLAVELSKYFDTTGFDINQKRIGDLKKYADTTGEIESGILMNSKLKYTTDQKTIGTSNFIIVAVPTPITKDKKPDLTYLKEASQIVGKNVSRGSIIVYESTVYPGVTEEVCRPILEKYSSLKCGVDFKIGYGPERINLGDKEHTLNKITKVIAGMDEETTEKMNHIYSKVSKNVFEAKDIKTAEAAKVIENIQRDLNIALMNELSIIFKKIGIRTKDVIEASATKWNFHTYTPGLVGGHCIGIDPYYLTHKARELGYEPSIILAGRATNESMAMHVVELLKESFGEHRKKLNKSSILVLGLTFKENVKDARNSKAKDLIDLLKNEGAGILAHDSLLEDNDVEEIFGLKNTQLNDIKKVDAVIVATPHDELRKISLLNLKKWMDKPILIDVKSAYDLEEAEKLGFVYKSL
ncbi:nucleotide sugar dehydrogenase [Candidatus Woesearchaeota archaeon]|nr:nucleotide sugar dehydrogenase [Candidatus Woesearchaeota archaeon]